MASEQTNLGVGPYNKEFRDADIRRASNRVNGKHYGDSRDDADRSKMQSCAVRQQALLPRRKAPLRRSSLPTAISDETLESLMELGSELKKIRRRLISEGYVIDGKRIYKPNENDN